MTGTGEHLSSPAHPARMRRLLAITVLAALALAGCVSQLPAATTDDEAAPADAPAPGGNQFLLDGPRPFTAAVSSGAEPMVLADKAGKWVWVGDTAGVFRTPDNGTSWHQSPRGELPGVFQDGWALAQDDAGTLYASTTQGQFINVFASTDNGRTWSSKNLVAAAGALADRPWLAARGTGQVALIQNNAPHGTQCLYSTDGGKTFLVNSYLTPAGVLPSNGILTRSTIIAGNAVFDAAGGLLFATDEFIFRYQTPCQGALFVVPLPPAGAQIHTHVRTDAQGRLYTAQPSPDNSAVELRGFATKQASSLKTLVVSPPELKSNTFATLDVGADEIVVAWYGTETAGAPEAMPESAQWNVFLARVKGFWSANPTVTWERVSTEPNHQGRFCLSGTTCDTGDDRNLLDYFGVDVGPDGAVHVAYGHDHGQGNAETRYARFAPPAPGP